ncbi:hypothetical protein [Parasutterella muris]|uniref:hypothetical protein n=1 Tax=Parasutterella muris TaxID=2565572 RepID=UPI0020419A0D|nr:hypothetical protein [Parasutterella muris]
MAYKYNVMINAVITDEDSISAQKSIEQAFKTLGTPYVLKTINLDQVFGYDEKPLEVNLPAQTPEQIIQRLTIEVQKVMDEEAKKLNYDSIFTAITYENDTNPKFAAEAKAFKEWRSQIWTTCYAVLDEVLSGKRDIPTHEELIALLPELVISYD